MTDVVALIGPTAVGKSEAAVTLSLAVGGEIVSADSVQVYRGCDIGTAKPAPAKRGGVPHHLIDVVDPGAAMTAGIFADLAREAIADIHARGRLPVVTGGTGLYVRVALGEWKPPRGEVDEALRAALKRRAAEEGVAALWDVLHMAAPERAEKIGRNDLPRILRAFEVGGAVGTAGESPYRVLKLGLWRPRAEVYRRIAERAEVLWTTGMVEETERLLKLAIRRDRPPLSSLGYREAMWLLTGLVSRKEAHRLFLRNSRHLAKRQMTWWRHEQGIAWVEAGPGAEEALAAAVRAFRAGVPPGEIAAGMAAPAF